jgi:hypothetical protein
VAKLQGKRKSWRRGERNWKGEKKRLTARKTMGVFVAAMERSEKSQRSERK